LPTRTVWQSTHISAYYCRAGRNHRREHDDGNSSHPCARLRTSKEQHCPFDQSRTIAAHELSRGAGVDATPAPTPFHYPPGFGSFESYSGTACAGTRPMMGGAPAALMTDAVPAANFALRLMPRVSHDNISVRVRTRFRPPSPASMYRRCSRKPIVADQRCHLR